MAGETEAPRPSAEHGAWIEVEIVVCDDLPDLAWLERESPRPPDTVPSSGRITLRGRRWTRRSARSPRG